MRARHRGGFASLVWGAGGHRGHVTPLAAPGAAGTPRQGAPNPATPVGPWPPPVTFAGLGPTGVHRWASRNHNTTTIVSRVPRLVALAYAVPHAATLVIGQGSVLQAAVTHCVAPCLGPGALEGPLGGHPAHGCSVHMAAMHAGGKGSSSCGSAPRPPAGIARGHAMHEPHLLAVRGTSRGTSLSGLRSAGAHVALGKGDYAAGGGSGTGPWVPPTTAVPQPFHRHVPLH